MTCTIDSFPDRAGWIASRKQSLGGSDAATLCGYGYGSLYELWADKVSTRPIDVDEFLPEYVEAGQFMEPAIIEWWTHRTKLTAFPLKFTIIRSPDHPFAHASPDALVGDDAGLDAKNAAWFKREEVEGELPLGHQIQAQHYMGVTGRVRWHFATVVGGNKLLVSTVERNDEFIGTLFQREREWWERHVIGRTPPEPDGSEATKAALKRMFPKESEGEIRPLDPSFAVLRDMRLAAEAEKKLAEEAIAEIDAKIKAAIGDAQFGVLPDGSGWQWKVEPRAAETKPRGPTFPRVLRPKKEIIK